MPNTRPNILATALTASVLLTPTIFGQQRGLLDGLANLSDAVSTRASSADRSGGNADWIVVKAHSTATLAQIDGAGSIKHIWFTINSPNPFHLRELVIRMYWDGEAEPSVEVPKIPEPANRRAERPLSCPVEACIDSGCTRN